MIDNPGTLLREFAESANETGIAVESVEHEAQLAPHQPHKLPAGKCAVYVFSLSLKYGVVCPAGVNRVLKVGRVGPRSNARFLSQHYNPRSARSTLAGSLVKSSVLWRYLGIIEMSEATVGEWIRDNLDRDNFYLSATRVSELPILERYLRGRLGPVFEGG